MSKKPAKKPDPKEIEAQRLAEEQKKKEEERVKQEEERKYATKTLKTGLEIILTEFCLDACWKSTQPKSIILEFMTRYLAKNNILENFTSLELDITAEFHVQNLIFCKEVLKLSETKTAVLVNLLWELLKHANRKYPEKVVKKKMEESMVDDSTSRNNQNKKKAKKMTTEENQTVKIVEKTPETDFLYIKELLLNHSVENPPNQEKIFDSRECENILKYIRNSYIAHYRLFYYVSSSVDKTEDKKITVFIDDPLEVPPLSEAVFLGDKNNKEEEEEDYVIKTIF